MNDETFNINKADPVKRQGYKESDAKEAMSAMSPPDAYEPPANDAIDYKDMHPFLQSLVDEHNELTSEMNDFEKALRVVGDDGVLNTENFGALNKFILYFDAEIVPHQKKEERHFFPILSQKFIDAGECSPCKHPVTGVDVLENEHVEIIQLGTLAFNYFELSSKLRDKKSKKYVLALAIQKSNTLLELLKLHIFREDSIVFSRAQSLLSQEEMDSLLTPV